MKSTGLLLIFLASFSEQVTGFTSLARKAPISQLATRISKLSLAKTHSEYTVVEDDDDIDDIVVEGSVGTTLRVSKDETEGSTTPKQADGRPMPQYGALSAGTVLQVQVGDMALARKAWKKRRRSGSPLLVPCSVLNVDRESMVRWNLIFLLEKFGAARKDGIAISTTDLSKFHRTFLKYPLASQVEQLGYDSVDNMVRDLFTQKVQESYGIRLAEYNRNGEDVIELKAPISSRKAHIRAARVPILQFRKQKQGEHGNSDTLTHTGFIHARDEANESEGRRSYKFLPLSAALRVSQKEDVETRRVFEGSVHAAVVFDYDVQGDGGSPLLTLSLNPGGARESLKLKPDRRYIPIDDPKMMMSDLSVGDGPFKAKVVHLLPGRALIDCEVGRTISSDGNVKVFGTLRFQDAVEFAPGAKSSSSSMPDTFDDFYDDEEETENLIEGALSDLDWDGDEEEDGDDDDRDTMEEELLSLRDPSTFEEGTFEKGEQVEDITEMFTVGDDGVLVYNDPETGEATAVVDDDEDIENENVKKSKRATSAPAPKMSRGDAFKVEKKTGPMSSVKLAPISRSPRLKRKMVNVGDEIQVFIRSVSQQSNQYTVTTNGDAVQGRTQKDMKKEAVTNKRISRLESKLGSLERIWALEGKDCTGTIRAMSKSGDGMYVQPDLDIPTGVATVHPDAVGSTFAKGDKVNIRVDGIDEDRGQISLTVISHV